MPLARSVHIWFALYLFISSRKWIRMENYSKIKWKWNFAHFLNPLNHLGAFGSSYFSELLVLNAFEMDRRVAFDVPAIGASTSPPVEFVPPVVWCNPLSLNATFRQALADEIFSRTSALRNDFVSAPVPKCKIADGTHWVSNNRSSFERITFGGVVSATRMKNG